MNVYFLRNGQWVFVPCLLPPPPKSQQCLNSSMYCSDLSLLFRGSKCCFNSRQSTPLMCSTNFCALIIMWFIVIAHMSHTSLSVSCRTLSCPDVCHHSLAIFHFCFLCQFIFIFLSSLRSKFLHDCICLISIQASDIR